MSGNPTTPLPEVRVAWRPEQFNRVTNGTFETNTTGWATTAGINAAGTSITRITTDYHSGSASASVVCSSTDGSGVNFDMGSDRYFSEASYGSIYVAVVWLKRASGSRRAKVILGSEGTSSDRATLTITDLPDAWTPYVIRWLPTGNRTDVQLAITNGSAEALTVRVDDVAVYLLDGFTQVENGAFLTDTTGWDAAGASIAGAATSITRSTSDGFADDLVCAEVVTTATAGSGVNYTLGNRRFISGRTYRLRAAIKRVSGGGVAVLRLGSIGTALDRATSGLTSITTSWAWYTVDWTPSADRTDVALAISNNTSSGAVVTMRIADVEVYEAYDDLGTDAGDMTWTRSLDAIGTASVEVLNGSGRYDPRYSSSPLYGSVSPGKRLMIRSVYANALRGEFYGTISTVEPRPWDAKVDLLCEDMLGAIRDADVLFDFAEDDTYRDVRSWTIDSVVTGDSSGIFAPNSAAHESLAYGVETNSFYRGTDGNVPALDLLADLNEATQSVHWVKPSPHAMIGWNYVTVDRATLTDTSSDFTVDETDPPADFTGVRYTHEALENRCEVPWQAYEHLPPPRADNTGYGAVVWSYDPSVYGNLGQGDEAPYLSYTDEAFGTDDDHPEPRWRYPRGVKAKEWRQRHKRGLKVKRRTRVYPQRLVPFSMESGDVRRFVIDFSVPVSGPIFDWDATSSYTNFVADLVEQRPQRIIVDLRCLTDDTIDFILVTGTPWLPLDDLNEVAEAYDSQVAYGVRASSSVSTAYIPSRGDAQGVGWYRTWRYGTPRLRPVMSDHNQRFAHDLTDHATVTLDRWRLSSSLFLVTDATWNVSQGGLDWTVSRDLEELPTHTDWFTLDDASKGLDDAVVLAY